MVDSYARAITYLRISITDRCNYRCRYCMPDGGIEKCAHGDICSLEELRDMAAAAVRCGVRKIRAASRSCGAARSISAECLRKFRALKSCVLPRTAVCLQSRQQRCAKRASRTSTSASTR